MGISLAQILIILLVVLILFGAGKLPQVMADLGKGIKNFRNGMKDEEKQEEQKLIDSSANQKSDQEQK